MTYKAIIGPMKNVQFTTDMRNNPEADSKVLDFSQQRPCDEEDASAKKRPNDREEKRELDAMSAKDQTKGWYRNVLKISDLNGHSTRTGAFENGDQRLTVFCNL